MNTHLQSSHMADDRPWRCFPYPREKSEYLILRPISKGTTAIVYKALCLTEGAFVAIKIIDLSSAERKLHIRKLLQRNYVLPNHPNILKPLSIFTVGEQLWVVMPFLEGGSLQSLISYRFCDGLDPECIASIMIQVLMALEALHKSDFVHCGVKPGNILLDICGNVFLSDFQVSSWCYDKECLTEATFTTQSRFKSSDILEYRMNAPLYWVPAELNSPEAPCKTKADIWSFGLTLLELFHGRPPIAKFPESEYIQRRIQKRFQFSDHCKNTGVRVNKKCPNSLKDLIQSCLHPEPNLRCSASSLLEHEFFKKSGGHAYIFKNIVMLNIPSVEERFEPKILNPDSVQNRIGAPEEKLPPKIIRGWKFNSRKLIMDLYYEDDSESRTFTSSGSDSSTDSSDNSCSSWERQTTTTVLEALQEKTEEQWTEMEETLAKVNLHVDEVADIDEVQNHLQGETEIESVQELK